MTFSLKNEKSYEELIEAGLPRLPKNYFYKFFVQQTGKYRGYLNCQVYSLLWGVIPIKEKTCHHWDDELADPSQAIYDIDDFVDVGKFTFNRMNFPESNKSLPTQNPSIMRFLNRRLP